MAENPSHIPSVLPLAMLASTDLDADLDMLLTGGRSSSVNVNVDPPMIVDTAATSVPLGQFMGPTQATSYIDQHPGYDVRLGSLVLADNGQDCEDTIDLRTARFHVDATTDTDDVSTVVDGKRMPKSLASLDNKACAVCGMARVPYTHRELLADLDTITAPFGGQSVLGAARCAWPRLRYPVVSLTVDLPKSLAALLTVGNDERTVRVTLRMSHDGQYMPTAHCWVSRRGGFNGGMLIGGAMLAVAKKQTKSIGRFAGKVRSWADALPGMLEAHATMLRRMNDAVIDRATLEGLATLIANDGKAVGADEELTAQSKTVQSTIANRVVAADGKFVPASTSPGVYTALQLLESATAFDKNDRGFRHRNASTKTDPHHESIVRMNRVLDGDTYATIAWRTIERYLRTVDAMTADAMRLDTVEAMAVAADRDASWSAVVVAMFPAKRKRGDDGDDE